MKLEILSGQEISASLYSKWNIESDETRKIKLKRYIDVESLNKVVKRIDEFLGQLKSEVSK